MDQTVHTPECYDFRQYDRIWQRVAPTLEPYPAGARQAPAAGETAASPVLSPRPETPAVPVPPAVSGAPSVPGESQLPGASQNPCCMGSAAAELLNVLTGYIEMELADRRAILALLRQAPSWARQRLRDIAADQAAHVRQLSAAHYLITGNCYRPSVSTERLRTGRWCAELRERYHAAACAGLNYARSADDTADPCLTRLLNGLSEESYGHAETLMELLERSLQNH